MKRTSFTTELIYPIILFLVAVYFPAVLCALFGKRRIFVFRNLATDWDTWLRDTHVHQWQEWDTWAGQFKMERGQSAAKSGAEEIELSRDGWIARPPDSSDEIKRQ